jgi:hypothetical protein
LLVRYGYLLGRAPGLARWRFSFAYEFLKRKEIRAVSKRQVVSIPR